MRFIPLFLIVALSAFVFGGCSDDDNPTANDTYTMTAITGPNGAVTPAGSTTVASGSNLLYTMTPDSGYHVDSVLVDGVLVDSTLTYTFINITSDHIIRAVFAAGTNPPVSYVGVMAGTGVSGTLTISIPTAKRVYTPSAVPGDTVEITATLKINGGATIPLTGHHIVATGQIHLEGGGYMFEGTVTAGGITGTFTYPGGSGIFNCHEGNALNVKTFCGRYQDNTPGTEAGAFNMTISGTAIYVIVYPDEAGGQSFSTIGSIDAENAISIYNPENTAIVIATGTLNPTANTVSGIYYGEPGGTWSGELCH